MQAAPEMIQYVWNVDITFFHHVTYHKNFYTSIKILTFLEKSIDILTKLEYDVIVLRNLEMEVRY